MHSIAKTVSSAFDPLAVSAIGAAILALRSGMGWGSIASFIGLVLLFVIVPAAGYLLWCVKTGRVSNWDMSVRRERVGVFVVFLLIFAVDIAALWFLASASVFRTALFFFLWFAGFFAITLGYKLSGHTGMLTLMAGLFVRWFGPAWAMLFLTVPVVAWSRVVLKRHSLGQTIIGCAYSGAVLAAGWLFGLLP